MFKLDKKAVEEMLDDDLSLQTLKNQFSIDAIWDDLEDKDDIESEEDLFNALMAVMYKTRPEGVL